MPPRKDSKPEVFSVGQNVSWWTGRGSQGTGTITRITPDRIFVKPDKDSVKGSDYRILDTGREWWTPINTGVPPSHINTEPNPWYKDS
jgi:hypothetical protein